jgi:uncharacterized membrane protein
MSLWGVFIALVGFILLAIAIVILVVRRHDERKWWMWAILAAGIITIIIGFALWVILGRRH